LLYASFTITGSGITSTLYAASALEILRLADRTDELEHVHTLIHESLSALQESHASLEHEAATDPLTRVANRRTAQGVISQQLLDMQIHPHQMLSLVFMDIDHFKAINDTYGHDAGDAALQHLAGLVESSSKQWPDSQALDVESMNLITRRQQQFLLARLGGEEFVLILPEIPTGIAISIAEGLLLARTREIPLEAISGEESAVAQRRHGF
jgi:GGDEF domain-containing protein